MDEDSYAFWNPSGFGPKTNQDFVLELPTQPNTQPSSDCNKGKSKLLEKVRKANRDNWRSFRTNLLASASNTEGYNFKLGRFGNTGNGFGKINQEILGWKKGMAITGFGKWNTGLVLGDECSQILEFPTEDFRLRCATEAHSKEFVKRKEKIGKSIELLEEFLVTCKDYVQMTSGVSLQIKTDDGKGYKQFPKAVNTNSQLLEKFKSASREASV